MKKILRKQVLQELKSLSAEEKQDMNDWLTNQLLQHPFYKEAKTIATYLSFPHEFQTARLIEEAQKMGKLSSFPKPIHMGKWTWFYMNQRSSKEILLVSLNHRGKLLSLSHLRLT